MYNQLVYALMIQEYDYDYATYVEVPKNSHVIDLIEEHGQFEDKIYFLGPKYFDSQRDLLEERLEKFHVQSTYIQTYTNDTDVDEDNLVIRKIGEDQNPLELAVRIILKGSLINNLRNDVIYATGHAYKSFEERLDDPEGKYLNDRLKLCMGVYGRRIGELESFSNAPSLRDFFDTPEIAVLTTALKERNDSQLSRILDKAVVQEINGVLIAVAFTEYRQKDVSDFFIENALKQGYTQVAVLVHNFTKGDDMYYINTSGISAKKIGTLFGGKPWGSETFSTAFVGNTRQLASSVIFELARSNL